MNLTPASSPSTALHFNTGQHLHTQPQIDIPPVLRSPGLQTPTFLHPQSLGGGRGPRTPGSVRSEGDLPCSRHGRPARTPRTRPGPLDSVPAVPADFFTESRGKCFTQGRPKGGWGPVFRHAPRAAGEERGGRSGGPGSWSPKEWRTRARPFDRTH